MSFQLFTAMVQCDDKGFKHQINFLMHFAVYSL
jgi:hypothetical protein